MDAALRRQRHDPGAPAHGRGKGGAPEAEALGRSRGGFTTKVHVRAEGLGKPVGVELTPGQRHKQTAGERVRPKRLAGDKAYSSGNVRAHLRRRKIGAVIPRTANERRRGRFDKAANRQRNRVERLINRLKQCRRIATRYEKRAANYRATLTVGTILLWL